MRSKLKEARFWEAPLGVAADAQVCSAGSAGVVLGAAVRACTMVLFLQKILCKNIK